MKEKANIKADVFFRGRQMVIATMHQKELVLAPLFENRLGVKILPAHGFNTDQFGTFCGEVERPDGPLEAAKLKCKSASEHFKCTLVLASEGSFGPHPAFFFGNADDELLLLMDFKNGWEFKVRELSTQTNFDGQSCFSMLELIQFAKRVKFPDHGLIVRKERSSRDNIHKGLHEWKALETVADNLLKKYGKLYVETDMRAMHNPTRMKVIALAAGKLIDTIENVCPDCGIPGFGAVGLKAGLPCACCGMPTKSAMAKIYACQHCRHQLEILYPKGKKLESPEFCDNCNP